MSNKTTWREHFGNSPRLAAIEAVFALIDKQPAVLETAIMAKMNRVMVDLNAIEREELPRFVRAAIKDREPVRSASLPMI